METAALWAQRSTCSRAHVGCVIARESRILTTGYNGAPAGMEHCDHACDCGSADGRGHLTRCKSLRPCHRATHAEANAIAYAARYGLSLDGASLFSTHMPCYNCCTLIVNAGLLVVVWETDYRDQSGLKVLEEGKIAFGRYRQGRTLNDMMDT